MQFALCFNRIRCQIDPWREIKELAVSVELAQEIESPDGGLDQMEQRHVTFTGPTIRGFDPHGCRQLDTDGA